MAEFGDGALDWSGGEAPLRAMLDSANVIAGVVELLDDDYRYVLANRTAEAFHGLAEGGLVGLTCRDLGFPEDVIAARMASLRKSYAAGGPTMVEYAARNVAGRRGWYLGSYSPIPGDRPRLSFVIVDITDQRRAQELAEAQSARLALALEATGLGIWEYDIRADRVDWDEPTRQLFGVASDDPIDFATYASRIHPEDFPAVRAAYEATVAGENDGSYVVEHRTVARDGRTRWVRGAARAILDADGRPVRLLGTAQDITDQVNARERQDLMLAELNHRVKNNLATVQAIVSHTLRASRNDMRQFREAFQDRLLSLARGHELLIRTSWQTPDLSEVLEVALEPFRTEAVRTSGPRLAVRLQPELAINMVMVLHELSTNAAKYGALSRDGGTVSIDWRIAEDALLIDWVERGGPPIGRPGRAGFGTRLKDGALRGFGGSVHSEFAPEGLHCRLKLPLGEAVIADGAAPERATS
ncbi:MAG: sensor histidine kinase [Phenylobacterium sp.]|uniref:sensor histidine kinase n=1 Tax=Phenylobacterium sp. TaxID=1871053 RepID=UPI00391D4869